MTSSSTPSALARGVLYRYRDHLPVTPSTPFFTLGEGSTPLVPSQKIGPMMGCENLYFKLESCNPTGSFKDRGMVVAVAKAIEQGSRSVLCASTGNTSASAAAYAARCGLKAYVLVPKGNIAQGKLAQAIAHGAEIMILDGNFDDALRIARSLAERHPISLVNSVNPYRLEGQKTAAFEIVDDLGDAPDFLFIPVGNAGNITAYWRGFVEYNTCGRARRRPRMMGYQAEGAAPIVLGHPVLNPQTVATAIRIGNPAGWAGALEAAESSSGAIDSVTDDEILKTYAMLAKEEGIFCEPASAAAVAGLIKAGKSEIDLSGKTAVCVITGSGLKDPETAQSIPSSSFNLPSDLAQVEAAMGLR